MSGAKLEPLHGIDLSHHQNPRSIDWLKVGKTCDFVIVRATYGLMRDKKTLDHLLNARTQGLKVGLYHFFRPSQDWRKQLELFEQVCVAANLGAGDIVPTIDIEQDPLPKPQDVHPSWSAPCEAFVQGLVQLYRGAMIYQTQRDWALMGKPSWVLQHPLWVAHWRNKGQPRWPAPKAATPGGVAWAIHQYGVGPGLEREGMQDHTASGALDHNISWSLPLIPEENVSLVPPVVDLKTTVAAEISEVMQIDMDEYRAARDRLVQEKD